MDYLDFDSKLLNIGAIYLAISLSHLLNISLSQSYLPTLKKDGICDAYL